MNKQIVCEGLKKPRTEALEGKLAIRHLTKKYNIRKWVFIEKNETFLHIPCIFFFFSFPFLGFVFVSLLEHGAVMQVKWRRSQLPFDVNFWIFPLRRASWRCTAGGRAGGACKRRSGSPDTTRTHPGTGIHTAPSHTDALGGTQILSIEQEQMDIFKLEAQVFQIFIYSVVCFFLIIFIKKSWIRPMHTIFHVIWGSCTLGSLVVFIEP